MCTHVFINRRKNQRRQDDDPCEGMDRDIFHRKRRKHSDRRSARTLIEDYEAFKNKCSPRSHTKTQ